MSRAPVLPLAFAFAGAASSSLLVAQEPMEDVLFIHGYTKHYITADTLSGTIITARAHGIADVGTTSNDSGYYELSLALGHAYRIRYGHPDMVSKHVEVDATGIPEAMKEGGFGMQVDMTLFPPLEGLDVAFLERPIGRARYVATDSNLVWDLAYTDSIRGLIAHSMMEFDSLRSAGALPVEEEQRSSSRRGRTIFKSIGLLIAACAAAIAWWFRRKPGAPR